MKYAYLIAIPIVPVTSIGVGSGQRFRIANSQGKALAILRSEGWRPITGNESLPDDDHPIKQYGKLRMYRLPLEMIGHKEPIAGTKISSTGIFLTKHLLP